MRKQAFDQRQSDCSARTQVIMIVQILIAQGQTVHRLSHEFPYRMLDRFCVPLIFKASCEPRNDSRSLFGLSQKETTCIRCNVSTIESANNFSSSKYVKFKLGWSTLCFHKAVSYKWLYCLWPNFLCHKVTAFSSLLVRKAGQDFDRDLDTTVAQSGMERRPTDGKPDSQRSILDLLCFRCRSRPGAAVKERRRWRRFWKTKV
jgi:hypothetical protein